MTGTTSTLPVARPASITIAEKVARAAERVEGLTPEALANELAAGDVLLVDLREPDERLQHGTIPGAVHAPRGLLEFYADRSSQLHRPEFGPARRVVLFCATGGRSALGAVALQELGYERVAHLAGGIRAWKQSGRPIEESWLRV